MFLVWIQINGKQNSFFFGGGGEGVWGLRWGWGGSGVVCGGDRWMDRRTGGNRFAPSNSSKFGAMK